VTRKVCQHDLRVPEWLLTLPHELGGVDLGPTYFITIESAGTKTSNSPRSDNLTLTNPLLSGGT